MSTDKNDAKDEELPSIMGMTSPSRRNEAATSPPNSAPNSAQRNSIPNTNNLLSFRSRLQRSLNRLKRSREEEGSRDNQTESSLDQIIHAMAPKNKKPKTGLPLNFGQPKIW